MGGNGEGCFFLHSNEGSSPSCKALGLIYPDRQKYISLWLSISHLTALHSQADVGGVNQDSLRNSPFSDWRLKSPLPGIQMKESHADKNQTTGIHLAQYKNTSWPFLV